FIVSCDEKQTIPLDRIDEAKIIEGTGVDRLSIVVAGRLAAEMRYTRHTRRAMTRLHRKLERRLPNKIGDLPPEWLENFERKSAQSDLCPKCGMLIPSYAEGVCPQCQRTRKILWRLLDVAKAYRSSVWWALTLTLIVAATGTLPAWFQRYAVDWAIFPTQFDPLANKSVPVEVPFAQRMQWL